MTLADEINRILRDHEGFSGDGQGGNGALPVGDRSTASKPISKRDLRTVLMRIAQTLGDPTALYEIFDIISDERKSRIESDDTLREMIGAMVVGGLIVGDWDPSSGSLPVTRPDGTSIRKGDTWRVTSSGSAGNEYFVAGDYLQASKNNPGDEFSGGWMRSAFGELLQLTQRAETASNEADESADEAKRQADLAEGFANSVNPSAGRVTYFVSQSGSDDGRGISPETAFLTLAKASAVAKPGDIVRLDRGGFWREEASFANGVLVEPFGRGERPIISGQDVVSEFAIDGTGPAYRFTINLPAGTNMRAYPGVWENGVRLREYRIGKDGLTSNAGVIAAVQANPGSFGFLSWSTNPITDIPGGWTAGEKEYIIHTTDGSDPATNGRLYETYARPYSVTGLATYKGIRLISGFHHDGVAAVVIDGSLERLARHGCLPRTPYMEGVISIDTNPAYGGAANFHSYAGTMAPNGMMKGCVAVGDDKVPARNGVGFYTHGPSAAESIRKKMTLIDCEAHYTYTAVLYDQVEEVNIVGFKGRGNREHFRASPGQRMFITDCDLRGGVDNSSRQFSMLGVTQKTFVSNSYLDFAAIRFIETGTHVYNIEFDNSMLIMRPRWVSGNDATFARATGAMSGLKVRNSYIINMGENATMPYLLIATSVSDVEFRDVLVVGQYTMTGVPSDGVCRVNGVDVPLSSVDANARAFFIDRAKVIQSDAIGDARLATKYGSYEPGDFITYGVAVSSGNTQPRATVFVGERVLTTLNSVYTLNVSYEWTPPATLRAASHLPTATRFIAVGDGGLIARSASGVANNWGVDASPVSDNLRAVSAVGSVVVSVGDAGAIIVSADSGGTWAESLNSGVRYTSATLRGVAGNGSTWVACGAGGAVLRSTDNGVSWSAVTVPGLTADMYCAFYSSIASRFFIAGNSGIMFSSPDGATWTAVATNAINRIVSIAESKGEVVAAMRQTTRFTDTFITSSDGVSWSVSPDVPPFEVTAIAGNRTDPALSPQHSFFAVGEAQSIAVRSRGPWAVQRMEDVTDNGRSLTTSDWLKKTV